MTSSVPPPLQVFISYSHKDEELREELDIHLANLKRQGKIQAWHDRAIEAGAEWDAEIKHQLETADIILLLITPRFIASNYCYDLEMQRAVQRHDEGNARVIPIIGKSCDWQDSPFSKLQVLPKDAKPVTKWDDRDEAFLNVVQGIRRAVETLQAKKSEGVPLAKKAIAPTPPPLTPSIGTGEQISGTGEQILGTGERPFAPTFSTYKAETWTGRTETVAELTDALIAGCRLLIIHGMTGIGKTALAEKLAADLLVNGDGGSGDRSSLPPDIKFHRISFDIGTPSTEFTRGAIAILQAIGDDTAQKLPDEQILPYLLKTLEQRPYWLQFDSLEYLLNQSDDGSYGFADAVWVEFFGQWLNSPRSQSRLILTSQALPADLVNRIYRYDQLWHEYPLRGLEAAHWLDLFRNYGITPATDTERDCVCAIAHYFQGHPLILKMIAGDIRSRLFGGSITKYWTEYYSPQQSNPRQAPSTLHQSQEQRACHWVSQTIQQLPDLPRQMLQRCAVFRRPVAESFYLQMLEDASDADRIAALTTLKSRNLVEDTDIQAGQLLIQQHNLIRDSAYAQLKATPSIWETAERTAAHLWLTAYIAPPNAEHIETVRGYLEAFDHCCEVDDWYKAKDISSTRLNTPTNDTFSWQFFVWGYYQEFIQIQTQLINCAEKIDNSKLRIDSLSNLGDAYYVLGSHEIAINYFEKVLDIATKEDICSAQKRALNGIGNVHNYLGNYSRAIEYYQQCMDLCCEVEDNYRKSRIFGGIGMAYFYIGNWQKAIENLENFLDIVQEINDLSGEANALGCLGLYYKALFDFPKAIDCHDRQLMIARRTGNRQEECMALGNLGDAYVKLENYSKAIEFHQQGLSLARTIGNRRSEAYALGNLGFIQFKLKQYSESLNNSQEALRMLCNIGDRNGEAEALKNLAELHQKLGEIDVAREYCEQALALATELGIPLVEECQKLWEELEEDVTKPKGVED